MAVTVRKWIDSDVDSVARIMVSDLLWQHYGRTYEGTVRTLHGLYREHERGFVATDNEQQIVGFVLYNDRTFGFSGYIRFLGVDARSKGQGIGRALILQVESDLLARQVNRLVLLCAEWNENGRRFYEKMGFLVVGELPDWVQEGTDEILYAKCL